MRWPIQETYTTSKVKPQRRKRQGCDEGMNNLNKHCRINIHPTYTDSKLPYYSTRRHIYAGVLDDHGQIYFWQAKWTTHIHTKLNHDYHLHAKRHQWHCPPYWSSCHNNHFSTPTKTRRCSNTSFDAVPANQTTQQTLPRCNNLPVHCFGTLLDTTSMSQCTALHQATSIVRWYEW